ncbi:transposase [Coraliomargarita algicola]|uniref:Transposase n=1 Tax=Coraliomargarita algicola TaxID=3092156 RepID=A0ABZ0RIN5_9BACT|nr:transposase [Coraliomargarita sp. J2-16]WPJ95927.1 transposase [Coraliomargarita sp. J2-16]
MENQASPITLQSRHRRFNESERREHVAHWKQSGLSASAYAREHALNYKSLYAWRSQSQRKSKPTSLQPENATFVPVRVSSPLSSSSSAISITLRSGSLECAIIAAPSEQSLVALVKSIKEEIFDV